MKCSTLVSSVAVCSYPVFALLRKPSLMLAVAAAIVIPAEAIALGGFGGYHGYSRYGPSGLGGVLGLVLIVLVVLWVFGGLGGAQHLIREPTVAAMEYIFNNSL